MIQCMLSLEMEKMFSDYHLPPEVVRGLYFHGRDIYFAMKYF